ncbi:hypothetical protein C0989_003848 [Termitomyces sp. Mn162]|nr:hypothetical protein C0989_003848 [Termitomyces sp. Mn162]
MTQPTPLTPSPDDLSTQDNAWSSLLSLKTQAQLTQAFLTSHTAKPTGLHQATQSVSFFLLALLECLSLAPTPPPRPLAAVERFSSAPSLELSASHSNLPCLALPDIFDGDYKVGECFLQSCITYIQLSSEALASNTLKIAWAQIDFESPSATCVIDPQPPEVAFTASVAHGGLSPKSPLPCML